MCLSACLSVFVQNRSQPWVLFLSWYHCRFWTGVDHLPTLSTRLCWQHWASGIFLPLPHQCWDYKLVHHVCLQVCVLTTTTITNLTRVVLKQKTYWRIYSQVSELCYLQVLMYPVAGGPLLSGRAAYFRNSVSCAYRGGQVSYWPLFVCCLVLYRGACSKLCQLPIFNLN